MKKIVLLVIILMTIFSSHLFAMDYIVGAKAGYFVWQPYFQEMKGSGIEEVKDGNGMLYGPVASIIFTPDISFSAVFLTGKQTTQWHDEDKHKTWAGNKIISTGNFYTDILRYDFDSALSYRILDRFKVFLGYKYQYTETTLKGEFRSYLIDHDEDRVNEGDVKFNIPSHGPGLGVGYSIAGNIFFATANLSAIYMFSKFNFEKNMWVEYTPQGDELVNDGTMNAEKSSYDTRQVGLNFEPSVGLRVENVVVTLGFRLQWMRTQFVDDPVVEDGDGGHQFAPKSWMNDYLYGAVVGFMYAF